MLAVQHSCADHPFRITPRKIERNLMARHEIWYPNDSRHRLKHRAATASLQRWRQGRRECTKFCRETSRPPPPPPGGPRALSLAVMIATRQSRLVEVGHDTTRIRISTFIAGFERETCQWSAAEQDISRSTVTAAAPGSRPEPWSCSAAVPLAVRGSGPDQKTIMVTVTRP